jgi:putative ABC transport system permease protein
MHDGLPKRFRVAGIVGLEDAKPPRHSAVYFSDAYLRQLAPRKAPDAVGVIAAPGVSTDKLKHRIVDALVNDNLSVHTGAKRSTAEFLDIANEPFSLLTLSAGIGSNVLLIAVFIVASTMALSIQHRRREIALLRAVGATPRQIRSMVRGEGMVLSVVGGVLGWPVGIWLVRWMSGRLAHYGLVPADFRPYVSPLPALGAVITVLATSVMAAHIAARRANRIRPTEALGDSSKEKTELGRGRKITGVILLISSIGLFVGGLTQGGDFTTQVSLANSLVLMVAITAGVLGPALSRAAILVLTPVLRRSKVTGYLAAANSRTNLLRMAGGVTPLVLAVSFAATVVFAQTTGLHVSSDQLSKGMLAQHVLAAPEGIPSSVVQRVRTLHGVDAATGVVRTKVVAVQQGSDGVPVTLSAQGLDSSSLHQTVDLQIGQGDWRGLSPGTVAMSRTASSWLDVGLGDKLPVYLGDGTRVEPRVVAIYERGLAFADLTFESSLLRQHTTTGLDQSVLVKTAGSTVGDELRKVAQEYPGITVVDQLDPDEQTEELKASAWVSYLLVGMLIVYTAITVINSQVMNTAARRREFALLRLSGASKRHIMRMMRWETASVIIAGVVMGTAASALPLVLVALALSGTPWPSVPILWYLGIVGSLSALAAIGALGTSRLVLRVRPVEAIGTKE